MKINLFKFLFMLWLAFPSSVVNAQNVAQQNLDWTSTTVIDIKNNAPSMRFHCSFKIFSNQSIDWLQRAGAEVSTHVDNELDLIINLSTVEPLN
jgi:hypothetical protein